MNAREYFGKALLVLVVLRLDCHEHVLLSLVGEPSVLDSLHVHPVETGESESSRVSFEQPLCVENLSDSWLE